MIAYLPGTAHVLRLLPLVTALGLFFSPSSAAAQAAYFYEHLDYDGESFASGTPMSFVGWEWNDRITSIYVPNGYTVTLYEHIDYGGAHLQLTESTADLRAFVGPGADGTWNDAASSILVTPHTRTVLLVNGSFNAYPPWMDPGSPEFDAIAATYGVAPDPFRWHDNGFASVTWPFYTGIDAGAAQLGALINQLPGEVYVVTHSHGGNVGLGAVQFFTNRWVDRLINLATPVNYDLRYNVQPKANWMCTASSWDDWVQFWGASPTQVYQFMNHSYYGFYYGQLSAEEWLAGNTGNAMYYAALAFDYIQAGYSWFESTKLELWYWTIAYNDGGHGDMHEPPVWHGLPRHLGCDTAAPLWVATDLGLALFSRIRVGTTTTTKALSKVRSEEPDHTVFEIPEGYTVSYRNAPTELERVPAPNPAPGRRGGR
jgi:Peptidase inhibitor family I36